MRQARKAGGSIAMAVMVSFSDGVIDVAALGARLKLGGYRIARSEGRRGVVTRISAGDNLVAFGMSDDSDDSLLQAVRGYLHEVSIGRRQVDAEWM